MPRAILLTTLATLLPAAGVDAAERKGQPDERTAKRVEQLINDLAETTEPGMGYSATVSGTAFLPLDCRGKVSVALLGQPPTRESNTIRELVKLGPAAAPLLVEHLGDTRPTRIAPLTHAGGIGGSDFTDCCDYNSRTQKAPGKPKDADNGLRDGHFHRVTVGDLCFVALGQIVNRSFVAVRYQPSLSVVINSPTRSVHLRAAVKEHWAGLTPERHKASLLADFDRPDYQPRRIGAAKRLAYYYPDALEAPALKLIATPTYDEFAVETFAEKQLYAAKDARERKKRFEEFVAHAGEPARGGLMLYLFGDLHSHKHAAPARAALVELYGVKEPIDGPAPPPPTDALSDTEKQGCIREGLIYDRSPKVDRAVRDLMFSRKDDEYSLASACAERLVGRGYDADIKRYFTGRPRGNEADGPLSRLGWTPVHVAVWRGRADELAELLSHGANPGAAADDGATPLHVAAKAADAAAVKRLLDAKAPPDPKDKAGNTPGRLAANGEQWDIARLLVDAGAPVPDLLSAAALGKADAVRQFVRNDPRCVSARTQMGQTALHLAAERGYASAAEPLLATRTLIDVPDSQKLTALHIACLNGHEPVVRLLAEHKADLRRPAGANGPEPIHLAAYGGDPKAVGCLLDRGIDVNVRDGEGRSPLHLAASADRVAAAELLLRRGAKVDAADRRGHTALHVAAEHGKTKVAAVLLGAKAAVDARANDTSTPMAWAILRRHREMVRLLFRHGADPAAKLDDDTTILEIAAATDDEEIIRLVREAGKKK